MTTKKPVADKKPTTVVANDPEDLKGTLKRIGGSQSDHWNNILANPSVTSWPLVRIRPTNTPRTQTQLERLRGTGNPPAGRVTLDDGRKRGYMTQFRCTFLLLGKFKFAL